MITTRIATALIAGALSVGVLAGAAGTLLLRDATAPQASDWYAQMHQIGTHSRMMDSGSRDMLGWMQQQHGAWRQTPVR